MCGIVGVCRFDGAPVKKQLLARMTDVIAHRGPDAEGHHIDGSVGLGARRLAILDLSTRGNQPMTDPGSSLVVAHNGEVYNFRELRSELMDLGYEFRSDTDTEVVLKAFDAWGEGCLDRFNGMFAFAILDAEEERLFLARDRYGIKPLYYFQESDRFHFASEIKAILEDETVSREIDPLALREYFTFQNLFSDRTLFHGIRLLPPGHFMEIDLTSGEVHIERYWDFDFTEQLDPEEWSRQDCAREIRRLFEQAVERQLVSDVPVGSFLSGGMDSGSIVAVASRRYPHLHAFTAGFDTSSVEGIEAGFDERDAAERMSREVGAEHYQVVLHPGDMERVLEELIWHLEDPRVGMCWQNHYAHKLAGRFVKVVLSGAGGDELFGGYPWRYERIRDAPSREAFEEAYLGYWQRLVPEANHDEFFQPDILEAAEEFSARETFREVFREGAVSDDDPLNRALYFELKTFLHGLFILEDKLSSAQSIEARVPFLDNELVEFAQKVPPEYKVDPEDTTVDREHRETETDSGPYIESNEGKQVLREAMEGLIPEEIRLRKKQGFSPPDGEWYRTHTYGHLKELLLGEDARATEYIQKESIQQVLEEHRHGSSNHRLLLWSLICFEHWCRRFLRGPEAVPEGNQQMGGGLD